MPQAHAMTSFVFDSFSLLLLAGLIWGQMVFLQYPVNYVMKNLNTVSVKQQHGFEHNCATRILSMYAQNSRVSSPVIALCGRPELPKDSTVLDFLYWHHNSCCLTLDLLTLFCSLAMSLVLRTPFSFSSRITTGSSYPSVWPQNYCSALIISG